MKFGCLSAALGAELARTLKSNGDSVEYISNKLQINLNFDFFRLFTFFSGCH